MTRCILVAIVAFGLVSCDSSAEPPEVPKLVQRELTHRSSLVFGLNLELDRAAPVEVLYSSPTTALTIKSDEAMKHFIPLSRLHPSTEYDYEARSEGTLLDRGKFRTDTLPADLSKLELQVTGAATFPLLLLTIRGGFEGLLIIDTKGKIVWYHKTVVGTHGVAQRANHNFVVNSGGSEGVFEVDVFGRRLAEIPRNELLSHHDVVVTARNTLLFLVRESRVVRDTAVYGESIYEWSPELNLKERRWNSFDWYSWDVHRTARTIPSDWLHANSLSVGPRGNILVSLHFLDQIVSIKPEFNGIEWRLGGIGSDFTLPANLVFSGQHTAAEIAPGKVLMFDNGYARADGSRYSRALELLLDPAAKTAVKSWEYKPDPPIWASIISSARRLPNGNTVVTFGTGAGFVGAEGPLEVHEVTSSGQVVWKLRVGRPANASFRGDPLNTIAGEALR